MNKIILTVKRAVFDRDRALSQSRSKSARLTEYAILPLLILAAALPVYSQIPAAVQIQILKAEDARRYDGTLSKILNGKYHATVTARALLAAGRIGDESAIADVEQWLEPCGQVAEMARFALGEIESIKAADAILATLSDGKTCTEVRGRAVEAAGKIAAANPKEEKSKELGKTILAVLKEAEGGDSLTVLLALTATLRARPEGADVAVAKFLTDSDPRIRADAANTLSRVRAKNANNVLRSMLMSDADAVARANAARALGAAEDKDAFEILLKAATQDSDSRVRVSAIRSLASLKDARAVDKLLARGDVLLTQSVSKFRPDFNPSELGEMLEIAAALGRLLPRTNDVRAISFLTALGTADMYRSPETEIAYARVAPKKYTEYLIAKSLTDKSKRRAVDAALQGTRELASLGDTAEEAGLKKEAVEQLRRGLAGYTARETMPTEASVPEILRSLAAFKPEGLDADLRQHLNSSGIFVRATVAELLAEMPTSKENVDALKAAYPRSILSDKEYNDASLAILDALYKLDKKASVDTFLLAAIASDYLVRKKAFELLADKELQQEFPSIAKAMENAKKYKTREVLPYSTVSSTRLGQLFATDADYRRAAARKNGSVKAVFATQKGTFTIDLLPESAPLTVDNFVKLARANYFNGLEVHRVVPNFVMQDGDPRGDGNGGPGWSIRCEVNMVPYGRGAVGMALSGKDTGGSQWFVTHSPQPHLDGGYTVFGKVNETDMKVVDNIVRGDKILTVRIIEGGSPQRTQRSRK